MENRNAKYKALTHSYLHINFHLVILESSFGWKYDPFFTLGTICEGEEVKTSEAYYSQVLGKAFWVIGYLKNLEIRP